MIPLTVGFLLSAPLSGWLSDRLGARPFTVGGALLTAVSFLALMTLPTDFHYWIFALLLVVNGVGSGLFASPNRAEIMNSVPADSRGAGSGMTATFQNSAMVLSIGIFFSLMIAGLSHTLPSAMHDGLVSQGVPGAEATQVSQLPPIAVLFAAFLGYNPLQQLLGDQLTKLPDGGKHLTSKEFFPHLISGPFHQGLVIAFWFAVAACLVAALSSLLTGRVGRKHRVLSPESLGSEMAGVSGGAGLGLSEPVVPDGEGVHPADPGRGAASAGRSGTPRT